MWKQHLEEKEERKQKGRERALRRSTLGYDEFNDKWGSPKGARGEARDREWDPKKREEKAFREDLFGWGSDFAKSEGPGEVRRTRGDGDSWDFSTSSGGGGGDDWGLGSGDRVVDRGVGGQAAAAPKAEDLESSFLDRLMRDLDGPLADSGPSPSFSSSSRPVPAKPAAPQRKVWDEGDDAELEAIFGSGPNPATTRGSTEPAAWGGEAPLARREKRGRGEGGAGTGTLSEAEQRELDQWLNNITGQEEKARPSSKSYQPSTSPGMGGKAGGVKKAGFTLDPEEEMELNAWLSRFDAEYSEGKDGKVRKVGLGESPAPRFGSRAEEEDEDLLYGLPSDLLGEMRGAGIKTGLSQPAPQGKRQPPQQQGWDDEGDAVDLELRELLAKLEAVEEASGSSGAASSGAQGKEKAARPAPASAPSPPKVTPALEDDALDLNDVFSELEKVRKVKKAPAAAAKTPAPPASGAASRTGARGAAVKGGDDTLPFFDPREEEEVLGLGVGKGKVVKGKTWATSPTSTWGDEEEEDEEELGGVRVKWG